MMEEYDKTDLITLLTYLADEAKQAEQDCRQWCDTKELCSFNLNFMSYEELFYRYRALANVRPPLNLPEDIVECQNRFLKIHNKCRGIKDGTEILGMERRLVVWKGDLTTLKIQSIVNSAHKNLLGSFDSNERCLDNDIHTFAGSQLRLECAQIMEEVGEKEHVGSAKITHGHNLPADYVIHTVGPEVVGEVSRFNQEDLASCYDSCLSLADLNDVTQVAFPCISTGANHYPKKEACDVAVAAVNNWLENHPDTKMRVLFCVNTLQDLEIYEAAVNEYNRNKAFEIEQKLQEEKDQAWRRPGYFLPNVH